MLLENLQWHLCLYNPIDIGYGGFNFQNYERARASFEYGWHLAGDPEQYGERKYRFQKKAEGDPAAVAATVQVLGVAMVRLTEIEDIEAVSLIIHLKAENVTSQVL